MSFNEKEEQKLIQMNDLFDELIEDAYQFSKDITFVFKLMPFAIGFFILYGIAYTYIQFFMFKNVGGFNVLLSIVVIGLILYLCFYLSRKYFELYKRYSTLFELKKELDKIKEI